MKLRRNLIIVGILILVITLCLAGTNYINQELMLTGWVPLIEGFQAHILIASDSGSLVAVDKNLKVLTYFPEAALNPENVFSYPFNDPYLYQPCFFEDSTKLLFSRGRAAVFNLVSGEFEPLDGAMSSMESYDCATLGNGDLVLGTHGILAFYSNGEWLLVEDPLLETDYEVAEGLDGTIWVGLLEGSLWRFDRQRQDFEFVVDLVDLIGHQELSDFPTFDSLRKLIEEEFPDSASTSTNGMLLDLEILLSNRLMINSYGDLYILGIENNEVWSSQIHDLFGRWTNGKVGLTLKPVVDQDRGIIWQGQLTHWSFFYLNGDEERYQAYEFPYGAIANIAYDPENLLLYVAGLDTRDDTGIIYYRDVTGLVEGD